MQAACTAADLLFDPIAHEYRTPDGQRVPGVTEILSAVGVAVDFEALKASSGRIGAAIDEKRAVGQALHADAHTFDDEDLVWASVDARVLPYLLAWQTFRENTKARPTTRERRVFHPAFHYAGTLDGIFVLPNGHRVLVDIKTGDPNDAGCQFQTAAYLAAHNCEHPDDQVHERWAVQLMPDRGIPYRITPYTNWQDFTTFGSFLVTYRHQSARRRASVSHG